jgi:(1->4)-alpha-D-glucan 1-alpha-D-glucosylmutase
VVVEKILGADEPLPANWPVAGTTGYDFLNEANGLFVDPAGLVRIRRSYQRFSRLKETFDEIAADSKRLILDVAMSSELHLLARRLKRVAERDRHARDFTLNSLLAALREVIVAFPVYRTYAGAEGAAEGDVRVIQRAIRRARRRNPAMDGDLFDFIQGTLCPQTSPDAAEARRLELFVGRFQQSTSPVMAKGIEDTAFYRDVCLASVNEVGAHPAAATVSIDQFHAANLARAARSPEGMICTSTHDTKRSEDVRSRLNVLSEIPDVWRTTLARWARWNRHFVAEQQGEAAPSRNDEYLFYQSVLGVWPSETPSPEQHEELERRLLQYMQKATHEAKLQTSWLSPNPEYDDAVRRFVQGALRPETGNRFLEDVQSLVRQIAPAALLNSLSGTLLKLTCPGVPDFYQGSELWDDSLVDPDNRRPVDFPLREKLLAALRGSASGDHLPTHGDWSLEHLADPSSKLFLTWRLLQARRRRPELFQSGAYVPLALEGPLADCFCAFARTDALSGAAIIVMAPRLTWKLLAARRRPSAESPDGDPLQETKLRLPDEFAGEFQHLITGETFERPRSLAALATWLDRLPLGAWFARGGQAPRSGVCLSSAATLSVAPASP